ncbi:MAG TPA: hypothetical protein VK892_12655 [Pyrinomonadaceae bacterium]|nr:hypothetical protein [Pyrinomonadaceae bacterium]
MLNKSRALKIAEEAIGKRQRESNYDDFSPVEFHGETDSFWIFVSGSQAMIDDGIIPGAFFAVVDKSDGHIWTRLEQENYFTQNSKPELQAA